MNRHPDELPTWNLDPNSEPAVGADPEIDSLAAYDERLRSFGTADGVASTANLFDEEGLPGELTGCLHLLERAWPRATASALVTASPQRIGRFEIERVLGTGGFGVVYLARDPLLHRSVALKVPRLHSLADLGLRERFRREARAAAKLDHPNIVSIYETAEEGPFCFIASAYCPGPTLAEWLKQQTSPVPIRLAASLVACLAEAIHYSHSQGVLHRDLKPGNVILMPLQADDDGQRGGELPFIPRLTDFGLAKLRDEGLEDATVSAALGTPSYMAPEQTSRSPQKVGAQVDVYSLGVMLYELLAGRRPFFGDCMAELLKQVLKDEPISPRRLRREVPRDLETICLKCLQKAPTQRYTTAYDLSEDLRRYLAGQPLLARPPGRTDMLLKWVVRRPLLATLLTIVAALVVAIPTMLVIHNQRLTRLTSELNASLGNTRRLKIHAEELRETAEKAALTAEQRRQEADRQRRIASRVAYASAVRLAELAWREADIRQCRMLLAAAREHSDADNPVSVMWRYLDQLTRAECREIGDPTAQLFCVAVSPDGRKVATGGEGGDLQIIDAESGRTDKILHTSHDDVRDLAYNAAGDRLAVCGESNTASVWSLDSGECLFVSPPAPAVLEAVAWACDDQWIAASGDFAAVRLWKLSSENETVDLSTNSELVSAMTVIDGGRQICAGGNDGTVWIWDAITHQRREKFSHGRGKISCMVVSNDSSRLAVGDNHRRVAVYRRDKEKYTARCELLLTDAIRSLGFSPQGDRLAVLEQFGTMRLWTLDDPSNSGVCRPTFHHGWLAHEQRGAQLGFLPNSATQLVSVGRGGQRLRLWNLNSDPLVRSLPSTHPIDGGYELPLVFSPDSTSFIASCPGPQQWSTTTLQRTAAFGDEHAARECLTVTGDGRWLAAGSRREQVLELWDLDAASTDKPVWRLPDHKVNDLAFSPAGDLLAAVSWRDDAVTVLDRVTGKRIKSLPALQCHQASFSPDGLHLAVDDHDDLLIWETTSWQPIARLRGHLSTIRCLAFSADGRWLASAGHDRDVRLWDATTWGLVHTMAGHRSEITAIEFTSDSRNVITVDSQGYVKAWDRVTGLEFGNLRTPSDGIAAQIAISPDGRHLAIREEDGRVLLQRLTDD